MEVLTFLSFSHIAANLVLYALPLFHISHDQSRVTSSILNITLLT